MYDDSIIILDFPFNLQEERDIINFACIFEHPYIATNTFITSLALTIFRHKGVFSFFSTCSYILDIPNVKYILRKTTIIIQHWWSNHISFLTNILMKFFFIVIQNINRLYTVKLLITNTSKEFIKCCILYFLIMECCRYLVF